MVFTESTALENQKSDTPKLSLQYEQIAADSHTLRSLAVSYTHLTLPTILRV